MRYRDYIRDAFFVHPRVRAMAAATIPVQNGEEEVEEGVRF
jgi:hypothetical protein